ncbi:MarR family winged helix-turn-helix transcriptional regulator [Secundilactobacillus yichangensis]|uniref:MarR family winged helix-turn-helix transcriptional regulator n=1 Tax=Secundilactobacillus yichangensis TaxID=2799580 RepID=UPI00194114CD|nr:MarR family transcriptional regulator [Secundilactobacillus yichangensis]
MTHKDSGADLAQQVALLNMVITNQVTEKLAPYEVNASNYFYVMKVAENPGICKSDFNNLVHLNHSTITRAINQLTKKELIRQSLDPKDKRATKLYLTEKGMRLNRGIEQYMKQLNAELMTRLAPNSDTVFNHIVKLRQSIEADHPEQL